jgi:hypothetical protein
VVTDVPILFEAVYHGDPVIVTHATQDEIELLAGTVDSAGDMLELWSLIAIHFGPAVDVHAIGWRLLLANAWVTSPLVAVDRTAGAVRTRSGRTYALGARDQPALDPELRAHLGSALKKWGFEDVRP